MKYSQNLASVEAHFDRSALARVCEMSELDFPDHYDLVTVTVPQRVPDDFYYFQDNGARVLAVAHLDTVGLPHQRRASFVDTEAGEVLYSRALDDRLGAYTILELLPAMGIKYDVLLTTGEESGQSTAAYFQADKHYDWIIEFDRGGTDVVLYQYEDDELIRLVRQTGAPVGEGIFSDVSYMEHVGVKGINWGVGYQDYHGPRAHVFLDDYFEMIARYLKFDQNNAGTHMPHVATPDPWYSRNVSRSYDFDDHRDEDAYAEYAAMFDRIGIDDSMPDDDNLWDETMLSTSPYFDDDFVENPTSEQIRRWEAQQARSYRAMQES